MNVIQGHSRSFCFYQVSYWNFLEGNVLTSLLGEINVTILIVNHGFNLGNQLIDAFLTFEDSLIEHWSILELVIRHERTLIPHNSTHFFYFYYTQLSLSPFSTTRDDFREVVYGFSEESSRSLKYCYNKTKKYSSFNQKIN